MGRPTRGAFSSSSRQASVSDLLPSPTALAARARRQPSSRRRHFAAAPASPTAPPRLGTPGRSVVGPGTPLPASSLAAATPAGISTPLHHQRARLGLTHVIWWRVPPLVQLNLSGSSSTSAYSVSAASRGGRRVLRSAAAAAVFAPSAAGPSPSGEAYSEFPHLARPVSATKHAAPPTAMLVHQDEASS